MGLLPAGCDFKQPTNEIGQTVDRRPFTCYRVNPWLTRLLREALIWRSFVDASMVPPISVRKKSAGAPRGLHKTMRRAEECRFRAPGRDLQRNVSLGNSVDGEQLQRHPGERS